MYRIVLVSGDAVLLSLARKFIPALDSTIEVITAAPDTAFDVITQTPDVDVIVLDENRTDELIGFINGCDRRRIVCPLILVTKDPDVEILTKAVNYNVEAFVARSGRDPTDFFKDLVNRIRIVSERNRNDRDRKTNEARMEAIIEIAKMAGRDFSEVVRYSLEKSVEITDSKIGYVAVYEKDADRLRMLAWSAGAMEGCRISNYPIEFDMRTTGVWGEPIRTGKSIVINDYEHDRKQMKKGTPNGHVKLERLLMVPIYVNGELIGTAGVGNKTKEYTESDEVQLTMLMVELFSIYSNIQEVKRHRGYTGVMRLFSEEGPFGFMYLDADTKVMFLNKIAADIMGCQADPAATPNLDSMRSGNADKVRSMINICRIKRTTSRMHMSASDGAKVYECSVEYVEEDDVTPGFAVWFVDVTYSSMVDARRTRAMDHIRILEGPVLNTLINSREVLVPLGDITDSAYPALVAMDNAVTFMSDYRNVGMGTPQWILITEMVERAVKAAGVGSLPLTVKADGFYILTDPEFSVVFKNLLSNTADHGGAVSEVSIACRIVSGDLTIIYTDDGAGIPHSMEGRIFDLVSEGKFGMFLVKTVVEGNGFMIKNVPVEKGIRIEITVPSSFYMMG